MTTWRTFPLFPSGLPLVLLIWIAVRCTVLNAQFEVEHKTAGEKFKNTSVLSEMPAEQMGKVMNIMSTSLGVQCSYCHEGTDFAKEGLVHKDTARKMLSMTFDLNTRFFNGRTEVTCNTCHRGQTKPSATISFKRLPEMALPTLPEPKPTAAEILANYLVALGGKAQLASNKTRHLIAKRLEPNGKSEPEELWQTASGLSRMVTQYGTISVVEGFDGKVAWKRANERVIELKPDEADQIRTEATIAFASGLQTNYTHFIFRMMDRIDGRDVYQIAALNKNECEERLYFDVLSGLLVRRATSVPTILGGFEYQADYREYQEFGGTMLPTQIRFAVPNITWTRQVLSVEINPEIDASLFRKP